MPPVASYETNHGLSDNKNHGPFMTTAKRDDMIRRNAMSSPFNDPQNLDNPSPTNYQPNDGKTKNKQSVL